MDVESRMPRDGSRDATDERPSIGIVLLCIGAAALALVAAVYFGGTGRTPLALVGTAVFVLLGGLGFDLARRRSV